MSEAIRPWCHVAPGDVTDTRPSSLPDLVPAARVTFQYPGVGRVTEYQGGRPGHPPVVLVHSLRPFASAAEVRPLFEQLCQARPVVALDLPGFGRSERNPPRMHRDVFADVIAEVYDRAAVRHGEAPHVIALGLGAELAAAAALLAPSAIRSLTMVSPTGFSAGAVDESRVEADGRSAGRRRWLDTPLIGAAIFALLRTRLGVRRELARCFVGSIDLDLLRAAQACARHPGARHAPLVALSGALADAEIRTRVFERLNCPVLVIHDRDPDVGFEELGPFVAGRRGWRTARIRPTRGLPHFERPEATMLSIGRFLGDVEQGGSDPPPGR